MHKEPDATSDTTGLAKQMQTNFSDFLTFNQYFLLNVVQIHPHHWLDGRGMLYWSHLGIEPTLLDNNYCNNKSLMILVLLTDMA